MKGSSDLACLPRDLQPSLEEGPPAEPEGWPGWERSLVLALWGLGLLGSLPAASQLSSMSQAACSCGFSLLRGDLVISETCVCCSHGLCSLRRAAAARAGCSDSRARGSGQVPGPGQGETRVEPRTGSSPVPSAWRLRCPAESCPMGGCSQLHGARPRAASPAHTWGLLAEFAPWAAHGSDKRR